MDQDLEQLRREGVYRALEKVEGWEAALRVRYGYWRGLATQSGLNSINSQGFNYLSGRADSWEEIIEMIKKSKTIPIQYEEKVKKGKT